MDLDDVVKLVEPSDRTRHQWARLGSHHGQACIARLLRAEPLHESQHLDYLVCVVEGLAVERDRHSNTTEEAYWTAYMDELMLYGLKKQA